MAQRGRLEALRQCIMSGVTEPPRRSRVYLASRKVGNKSIASFQAYTRQVRCTPNCRHIAAAQQMTFRARTKLMQCSKRRYYSITASASASNVGGTSMPSALAVLRLIASSYLVGACTGRSAGLSPLRIPQQLVTVTLPLDCCWKRLVPLFRSECERADEKCPPQMSQFLGYSADCDYWQPDNCICLQCILPARFERRAASVEGRRPRSTIRAKHPLVGRARVCVSKTDHRYSVWRSTLNSKPRRSNFEASHSSACLRPTS